MTIVAKNLIKTFGNLIATNDISFSVKQGEIFCLLGPNGAGKTTLVRILSTLLKPDQGTAEINGYDIITEAKLVRRSLGIISYGMAIYEHLTPLENIEFFGIQYGLSKKTIKKRAEELFDILDLNNVCDIPVKFFSTGMKRKAEIAVALINDPQVILCDEITAGLDPQMALIVREKFGDFAKKYKKTILWTTHYLNEPEAIADRVGILFKGRLVAAGTLSELKKMINTEHMLSRIHCKTPDDIFLSLIKKNWPEALLRPKDEQIEILSYENQCNAILRFLIASGISILSYESADTSNINMEKIFIALISNHERKNN